MGFSEVVSSGVLRVYGGQKENSVIVLEGNEGPGLETCKRPPIQLPLQGEARNCLPRGVESG